MAAQYHGVATLPTGSRYYDGPGPKTPEPLAQAADEEPSLPPPRQRLRLKRRHVSQLTAPTQQFLESIAAADVPIPSIEESHVEGADQEMMDTLPAGLHVQSFDDMDTCQRLAPSMFSPPKTPAIDFAPSPVSTHYPDWYRESSWSEFELESSPDYESSRPSTAFSTQTSSSLFSMYSSHTDDGSCLSPELETREFPEKPGAENARLRPTNDTCRKAPWTRAMSAHLWATYMLYLSDPRVTPLRLGRSCIPPHGVCARVARQAQRSWKGSRSQLIAEGGRSKSITPTAESAKTYMQWPHTGGATRAHLRELCKAKATNKPGRYLSRSPTPFSRTANRRWNRRTPARSPSAFSGRDLAMSLVLSTSDTMQPHGALAQLSSSHAVATVADKEYLPELLSPPQPSEQELGPVTPAEACPLQEPYVETQTEFLAETGRPESPFFAKSYGPSASSSIAVKYSLPKQPNTVGPRRLLKSPVRLARSRSGTIKRKSAQGEDEKAWKRPSLAAAFFREGSHDADEQEFPTAARSQMTSQQKDDQTDDALFQLATTTPLDMQHARITRLAAEAESPLLASPSRPPRLGSPFSTSASSYSFPNRLSSASGFSLSALRRPFATVQPSSQTILNSSPPPRATLASRLAYLDQRLKEFRHRATDRRRSQSPL
ncbi:hypothetical protein F5Y17DRAFT_4282 [Xylariaceae sp. FL0594]|nr:hypothetical protein F5Y17DRAFT_4282 [Xylariaceae sp. FL0594]